MDDQCSWSLYYPDEGMEEYLKHSLLYTTLELEGTIFTAREELARKDDELEHFKILLAKTVTERDEAVAQCQRLLFEKMILQQMQLQQKKKQVESVAVVAAPSRICGISDDSSDCDENGISVIESMDLTEKIETKKPLPEKGKFLKAVMEAGPLLQTLLLAGPLPQWQHPPPHLSSIDIPPVTISSSPSPPPPRQLLHLDSCLSTTSVGGGGSGGGGGYFNMNNKRVFSNYDLGSDSSPISKHQRVAHLSSLTPTSNPLFS